MLPQPQRILHECYKNYNYQWHVVVVGCYTSRTGTASSSSIIRTLTDTARRTGIVANTAFLVIDPVSSCRYAPTPPRTTTTNAST
jgi:hypothetical protein